MIFNVLSIYALFFIIYCRILLIHRSHETPSGTPVPQSLSLSYCFQYGILLPDKMPPRLHSFHKHAATGDLKMLINFKDMEMREVPGGEVYAQVMKS